jgi:hypothetical protein
VPRSPSHVPRDYSSASTARSYATVDDFRLATIYRWPLLCGTGCTKPHRLISPKKALFMSEPKKAIVSARPMSGPCPENKSGERNSRWWIYGQGSVFNLPFKRSDVFTRALASETARWN